MFSCRIKDEFYANLKDLLDKKQHIPVFFITQYLLKLQSKSSSKVIPQQFVSTLNQKMIKYTLSQKFPIYADAIHVFKCESVSGQENCMAYLKKEMTNNSQLAALSTFSEQLNCDSNSSCVADEREKYEVDYFFIRNIF